jgi:hypothetical protein
MTVKAFVLEVLKAKRIDVRPDELLDSRRQRRWTDGTKQVFENRIVRAVRAAIGALILAAIGGLWEEGLRPAWIWLRDIILTIGTLGIQSPIDNIYYDVGRGGYDRASIAILSLSYGVIIAYCISIFEPFWKSRLDRSVIDPTNIDLTKKNLDRMLKRITILLWILIPILVIGVMYFGFNMTKILYVTDTVAKLDRYQSIVLP